MRKIAIICSPGNDNHLAEVVDYFKLNYETKVYITNDLKQIFKALQWAETVWIEWADQSAIDVTRFERLLFQKQVILRLHSYEAFTSYLDYIRWSAITDLIFVAEHVKDIVLKKYPVIKSNVNRIHVIPNGIDMNKFKLVKKTKGKDLAYLGQINHKKAPMLLFVAFAELLKIDSTYKLHIGGVFQEERYALYLGQMQRQNPLFIKQIQFHGWIENPEEWLEDKSHIICTSVFESQGKGIMEAMSMGLKPVIHNFVGADTIYMKKYIWKTVSEFCEMVLSNEYLPNEYRGYIAYKYNRKDQLEKIKKVLEAKDKKIETFLSEEKVKPVTLSVTMIMRDEEKYIGRCLESIKDIADEIIIVDTGSIDKSIEIAKSYGAKIYHHPWQDNFSLHRNQSIGYSTGDWLLFIDADEELVGNKKGLKECLSKLSNEYHGVSVKRQDICKESGTQFNISRVFRKGKIKYRRAIHNVAIYERAEKVGAILFNDVTIIHHGSHNQISVDEAKKKENRTGPLLEKALKEDPEDYELLFYLMQFYGSVKDYDKAEDYGEQYLAKKNLCDGFNDSVYYTIIRIYLEKKNYNRAHFWLKEAQIILPDDLDIAFVMTELGVVTGNVSLMLQGARNFIKQYDVFQRRPDVKGNRFIFSQKPDCLYFCLKHITSYLLGDGVNCLDQLKKSIGFLSEKHQVIAAKEVEQMLKPIGVSTN